ncbi:MAG: class I SAM-dependent methyltransferase [Acidobacteria bacterium]|nr:MAG: class I SAM-dependent methyltransferase [Acidobacteriota bacterium]REK02989.1 MAG: class I SAM-dependent methyltransferase [Acidobacteriota bacterium]REK13207.1 MAG: class I SAM-dependent methyltransferase [Acidobacteriota bacterium]REK41201.1 MAG: class I SAM-dependent methyltransferase [Acidobacteriota bacterium]
MNANKALWEKGNFSEIAAYMRDAGREVAEGLGIKPGMKVLELGCGDGTTAIPIAELGAEVLGVDIASNLVAAGNRRAAQAGLTNIRFQEGDACDLKDIPDDTFDLTHSCFGAMFAPDPVAVAKEMVRVTKPGGKVVMGNWIPGDKTSFVSLLLQIGASYTPPPPVGFVSPMLWGVEAQIVERFQAAGVPVSNISTEKGVFTFVSDEKTPEDFIDSLRTWYGPTMNAYEAARELGKEDDLHRELVEMANSQNRSENGRTSIPATYLKVSVRVSEYVSANPDIESSQQIVL